MSFNVPSGAVAGEPDDGGESEVVQLEIAVIKVANDLGLLRYVIADPVLGIGF